MPRTVSTVDLSVGINRFSFPGLQPMSHSLHRRGILGRFGVRSEAFRYREVVFSRLEGNEARLRALLDIGFAAVTGVGQEGFYRTKDLR